MSYTINISFFLDQNKISKLQNMKKNISLKSIFAIRKDDLSQKLNGLTLPKDAQRVRNGCYRFP